MSTQSHSLVKRILAQLPPEERHTFSARQINALHQSALSLPKTSHIIHIRWSLPFPGKGFYFVFFAGKERRSRQRLLADQDFQLIPRVILLIGILLGCTILFGLAYGQRRVAIHKQRSLINPDGSTEVIHPTVVPFKYDQKQCETSHRKWEDGQCIDYDHDPTF